MELTMQFEEGQKVMAVRAIEGATPYSVVKPIRVFADADACLKSIPEGTPGVVVQDQMGLFVSFDEPGVDGRAVPRDAIEPIC